MNAPARTARLLHLALMGSVTGISVTLALLPASAASLAPLFLYAVFGVAAIMFAGALVLSSRLTSGGRDVGLWWRENLGRALVMWAMIEGPSLLGAVAYLLSRDLTALFIPAVGLVLLMHLGPARLEAA